MKSCKTVWPASKPSDGFKTVRVLHWSLTYTCTCTCIELSLPTYQNGRWGPKTSDNNIFVDFANRTSTFLVLN